VIPAERGCVSIAPQLGRGFPNEPRLMHLFRAPPIRLALRGPSRVATCSPLGGREWRARHTTESKVGGHFSARSVIPAEAKARHLGSGRGALS
jgi:hypothetical protein